MKETYGLKELTKQAKLKPATAYIRLMAKADSNDKTTKFASQSRTGKWLLNRMNSAPKEKGDDQNEL